MTNQNNRQEAPRIFVAVGHGGPDSGAVNRRLGLREADCNLAIAMLLERDLKRHGVRVKLSRYVDEEDRLQEEIDECNAYAPDFAIEIHTNASVDGKGSGFEVYHQMSDWANSAHSVRMAKLFDQCVRDELNVKTRGLKSNRKLGWLKQVKAPCILVENFFIDGPKAAWYSDPAQLAKLSRAYARAILTFYGLPYQSDRTITLRYGIVGDALTEIQSGGCPALLVNGNHYVHLRQFARSLGFAVYYDATSKRVLLYSPETYVESAFQDGLFKRSDYCTEAEQILAGIPSAYSFDEYDYDENGQLVQSQSL